ncbi:MAG: hypothetical protein EA378_02860 [Phycisphaerales bacterium]|nr:MAG: hypothetical protein EA378_02860 [Phycisphaerales bacterium]
MLASCLVVWGAPSGASAQGTGAVGRVNAALANVSEERRSDLILLPRLAAMDDRPGVLSVRMDAVRKLAAHPDFPAMASWAMGAPQRAVLEAIREVTEETDYRFAHAFAQPYGAEGVPIDLIAAGLYTELGDPPLLASAQHGYMDRIADTGTLVHVEASRLAGEGEVRAAADLLVRWAYFCRQMADRPFAREKVWGMREASFAMERIRDVVYLDTLSGRRFSARDAEEVIAQLDSVDGFLGTERIRVPIGDRVAAEQVAERVLTARGANTDLYATTLAQIGASNRPLRLFGEAARYEQGSGVQAGLSDTRRTIEALFADLESRWRLPIDNARLRRPFEMDRLARPSEQAVAAVVRARGWDPTELMAERDRLRTEIVGTRQALAIVGYRTAFGGFPPVISSVRPRWLRAIEADPFNRDRARGRVPPLEYFVPIRDVRASNDPHEMIGTGYFDSAFSVSLFDDTFVLYSVGFNGRRNFAERIENDWREAGRGQDYLIWPPLLSLSREAAPE